MEGLPTRSSEISPFLSSKQNWESQASNNSGGPAEGHTDGQFPVSRERTLGLQRTLKPGLEQSKGERVRQGEGEEFVQAQNL